MRSPQERQTGGEAMQLVVVLRRGSDARLAPLAGRRAPVTQASRRSRRPRHFAAHACTGRGRRAHVPYAETSGGVKALVAGLTGALNALAGVDAQAAQRAAEELARGDTRPPLDPQEGERVLHISTYRDIHA